MSHVVVERSGIVESIHRVHVAVVDQKGNLLAHVGDPEYLTQDWTMVPIALALLMLSGLVYLGARNDGATKRSQSPGSRAR